MKRLLTLGYFPLNFKLRHGIAIAAFSAQWAFTGTLLAQTGTASSSPARGVLQAMIVTSDPLGDRTVDEIIHPVTVVAGDKMEMRRAPSLGEFLDGLPGVANSDFGPGVGRPVIRGLQGSRVKVLHDGLGVNDVSGEGADHSVALEPAHARQVEVFRGPASLLYGSGAAGGVVNVRSNRFDPDFGDRMGLVGELAYGKNGADRRASFDIEMPLDESFVLRAEAALRRTGDFSIKGFQQIDQTAGNFGTLRISSIKSEAYSLTGLHRGDWGYIGLSASTWKSDYGIPENFDARPRDIGGHEDHFERIAADYDRLDLRGEFLNPLPGFTTGRLKVAYSQFRMEEAEFEFDRTPEGGELDEIEVEALFRNREFDSRLEMVHDPIGNWRGVVGVQHTRRDFFADDPRGGDRTFYVRPVRNHSTALFVIEELPTGFGRIELGGRIERERSNPETVVGSRVDGVTMPDGTFRALPERPGARSFTPFSLSAGAIVDVGAEYHLRGAITRSQRSPSPEQLWAFGRHSAAGTFEVGDLNLGKESYLNFEVGLDRHAGPFRFDLTLFHNRVDDFIFLQTDDDGTGSPVMVNDIGNRSGEGAATGCAPDSGGLCRLRNLLVFNQQEDARFYGAEFSAVAEIADGPVPFALRFNADHVRGSLKAGGNLPRITPTRAGIGIDTGYESFRFSADLQRVFRQGRTAALEDATSGYSLLSFYMSWRPQGLNGLDLFLSGSNLLNEDGRRHQSFFKDEAPIIGRAFTGGVRFRF